jgi:hypothetical protein
VYDSLLAELDNSRVDGHEQRCLPHLADCLYQVSDSCPDLFAREICRKLLLKTRSKSHKVACRSLAVLQRVIVRVGDSMGPVLGLVVHHLHELERGGEGRKELSNHFMLEKNLPSLSFRYPSKGCRRMCQGNQFGAPTFRIRAIHRGG